MPVFPQDVSTKETIQFIPEDVEFELERQALIQQWILQVIHRENRSLDTITYIFCSDEYLHKINVEYLNHDTYTDIITFSLSEEEIESDIFISIDRIKENAKELNVNFETELHRVIIHGVLHLCGYKDKSKEEQELMTVKENEALDLLEKIVLSQ